MSDTTLSFFGDICQDGTLTVILALTVFSIILVIRQVLEWATERNQKQTLTNHHWLERALISPFVPSTLESYIAAIFFAWFIMTIPMATTRYYESRWAHQLVAQQGPLNIIANACGCQGLGIDAIPYPLQTPTNITTTTTNTSIKKKKKGLLGVLKMIFRKKQVHVDDLEYSEDIDFYFSYHLFFGTMWLTMGALQIFWARNGWSTDTKIRHKAHRYFGYFVALPAFLGHITMAARMAWRNPVHQVFMITTQYWATIVESILLVAIGIAYRRMGNTPMHMVRMFFAFVQSVFGSGAVRLTAWILWLIGKFFPMPIRMYMDRGACQTMAIDGYPSMGIPPQQMGSAEYCWIPVFLNLALTDALILWLEWIFLCMPIAEFDMSDKKAIVSKFKQLTGLLLLFIVLVALDAPALLIQTITLMYAGMVRLNSFRMWIATFADDEIVLLEDAEVAGQSFGPRAKRLAIKSLLKLYQIPHGEVAEAEQAHPAEHAHQD